MLTTHYTCDTLRRIPFPRRGGCIVGALVPFFIVYCTLS